MTTISSIKKLWISLFLNRTDRVTKVSEGSVLNALAYTDAVLQQKTEKDIGLLFSHTLLDTAYSSYLDNFAVLHGFRERGSALPSSTYVKVYAEKGTVFSKDTHFFLASNGVKFELFEDVTVGDSKIEYIFVKSLEVGVSTNVEAFSINSMSTKPQGFISVVNEYPSEGGSDYENDALFRRRLQRDLGTNLNNIESLENALKGINERVHRVYFSGVKKNQTLFKILTSNGVFLTDGELAELEDDIQNKLSFSDTDLRFSTFSLESSIRKKIVFKNFEYTPLKISMRVAIKTDLDSFLFSVKSNISKLFNYTDWLDTPNNVLLKLEWEELLNIIRNDENVSYVDDNYFSPRNDLRINKNKPFRITGFKVYDLNGNLIIDEGGYLLPFYSK